MAGLGMTYHHLPVPFDLPTARQVRLFCGLMAALSPDRVFVHCILNYRVSVFMFHYLTKVARLPEPEARSPIFDLWTPDEVWADLLGWTAEQIGM